MPVMAAAATAAITLSMLRTQETQSAPDDVHSGEDTAEGRRDFKTGSDERSYPAESGRGNFSRENF